MAKQSRKSMARMLNIINSLRVEPIAASLPGRWTHEAYTEFVDLLGELFRREKETLRIYRPLPIAMQMHMNCAGEIAIAGSNRGGKTLSTAAEVAMCATHTHYLPDKYPKASIKIACIGNDDKHLALMYEYLFEKAQFQIFCHPDTYEWTIYNQNLHKEYEHLCEDAEPLIPERFIKHIAWKRKKEMIPKVVFLKNGTVIRFYGGLVKKLPRGRKFDVVWMDEELEQPKRWLREMRARLIDTKGKLIWSATQHKGSYEFTKIEEAASRPDNANRPILQQSAFFTMVQKDNIYLPVDALEAFADKMSDDPEEYAVRVLGQSPRRFHVVYHMWDSKKHVVQNFQMRYEDTRRICIDPGVGTAAVSMVVSPAVVTDPAEIAKLSEQEKWYRTRPGCIVVVDEVYIHDASAMAVALEIREMLRRWNFSDLYSMLFDIRGGRLTIRGNKDKVSADAYMEQVKAFGIDSFKEGWEYGSDDMEYGVKTVMSYLNPDPEENLPSLFVDARCKWHIHEFEHWKKRRHHTTDEVIGYEKTVHLLDNMRYVTTHGVPYVPPRPVSSSPAYGKAQFREMMNKVKTGAFWPNP